MLTAEEKKDLSLQVEEFVIHALGPMEGEEKLKEASSFLLKEVEARLDFTVTFYEMGE